jgi:hypothetical protein
MIDASLSFSDSSKRWLTGVSDNDGFYPTNWIRSGDFDDTTSAPPSPNGDPTLDYEDPPNYLDELSADPEQKYESVLGGTIAPHRLVGYQASYMPLAYIGAYSPTFKTNASISFLPSVNIVFTNDKSKWTRCPVIELCRNTTLSVGATKAGYMRKSPSVNKDGEVDNSGTGMGWFPGYAVDLESGARLYMAFGENSFLGAENGADMLWNPTDRLVSNSGAPLMGGVHPIYIFSYKQKTINGFSTGFDFPAYIPSEAEAGSNFLQNKWIEVEANAASLPLRRELYGSLSWVAYPMLEKDQTLLSTDAEVKLRINKEYKNFVASGDNNGRPMYSWSMENLSTKTNNLSAEKEALKLINIVPNPYYAFSEYEQSRLDSRIKITNLPEQCIISIYSSNGKLIKRFKKDSPITYQDWTLTNHQNIPVASGVYLIHVEVPEVGERVLKAFIAMRLVDLQNM